MIPKTAKAGGAITQYEYDAENKLARVVTVGKSVNYRYDGMGIRVEKEIIEAGTKVTRYVCDNEDILLELDGTNAFVARYTHGLGIGEPIIMVVCCQIHRQYRYLWLFRNSSRIEPKEYLCYKKHYGYNDSEFGRSGV